MDNVNSIILFNRIISIVQMILGVPIAFLFSVTLIGFMFDPPFRKDMGISGFIMMLILDAIGIALVVFSRRRSKLLKEFRKYVVFIQGNPDGSLDRLAANVGTSVEVVRENLKKMIKKNYFREAYIDFQANRLIIEGFTTNPAPSSYPTSVSLNKGGRSVVQKQVVPVTCKNCGGINRIDEGSVVECEFCGSPISSDK